MPVSLVNGCGLSIIAVLLVAETTSAT